MTTLSYFIDIFPDAAIILEVLLITLVLCLVGTLVYLFFIHSMQDDAGDRARAIIRSNPWERLNNQTVSEQPSKHKSSKAMKILLILSAVAIVALIFLILAIKFGWISNDFILYLIW